MIFTSQPLELGGFRPDFNFFELQNGTHDIVDEQPNQWSKAVFNFIK
ncbi:MAG: hypothetical protein Ct9H300mP6_06490 [Gammaproteobacteria bacterium]|nr:MAG: hypothetical protein Ct9H300mP6_06490 [Gammaproteobacteria bacterium]